MPPKPPVHFHAFIPANHKYLHAHRWTCSSTYLRIFILSFRLTLPVHFALALHIYTDLPVHQDIPIQFSLPFRQSTQNYMSNHLLVCLPRDVPSNKSTCIYIDVFLPANHRDLPGRIKDINYKNVQVEQ